MIQPTPQPWTVTYFLETDWLDESFYIHLWVQTWTKTPNYNLDFIVWWFVSGSDNLSISLLFILLCSFVLFYPGMIAKNLLNSLKIRNHLQLQPISRSACATGKYVFGLFRTSHVFCILQTFMSLSIKYLFLLNILLVCSPWVSSPFVNKILTNLI